MKTVLLTGASGFVGSHFIEKYATHYQILATWNTHPITSSKALTIQLNLLDKTAIIENLKKAKPEVILHLAGKAKTWGNSLDELMQDNYQTTKNLFDAVLEVREEINDFNPKIIVITSAEVYGKTINPESIEEQAPFFPLNEYGLSKGLVDRMAYLYTVSKKLNNIILRTFNHSGPGQKPGFFISDMASQIVKIENGTQNDLLVGNLSTIRDVLDVRDVVVAYHKVIEADLPSGEAYNICSGKGIKMEDILQKLLSLSSKKIIPQLDQKKIRPSDNPIIVGNHHKITQATGWQPTISLETTLQDCLNFWRERPE